MLICVKSRIAELEQEKASLPDSKELVSLKADKTEANGVDSDQDSNKIKIVAKIFLNDFEDSSIGESIECLLKNCSTTPTVILAYHPTAATSTDKFVWADNNAKSKENFKALWRQLQEAQAAGKIAQLGIADMDLETILDIFDKKYDFTILQINTQTCCVVPPELQQFCKDHDIQLLTHSDPQSKRVLTSVVHQSMSQSPVWSIFRNFPEAASRRAPAARFQNQMDRQIPRDPRLPWDSHEKRLHRQSPKVIELRCESTTRR